MKNKNTSFFVGKPFGAPESPVAGGGATAQPGMSNTRSTADYMPFLNVCLDWLKVRIKGEFSKDDEFSKKLMETLKLKIDDFDSRPVGGFNRFIRTFDEGTHIIDSLKMNEEQAGFRFYFMELSGAGCRAFESRGGDWKKLFDLLSSLPDLQVKRIDATLDDFSGLITPEMFMYRIRRKLYTSQLRTYRVINGVRVDSDSPDIQISRNDGFTATFGGIQGKQLVIYNKKAERISKDYQVVADSWMRYESRWRNDNAMNAFAEVYTGLLNNSLGNVVAGMIRGLVEFKENNNYSVRDFNKAPIWKPWEEVLGYAEKIDVRNQAKVELTMAQKMSWFAKTCAITLAQMRLTNPEEFDNLIGFLVYQGAEKMSHEQFMVVNRLRENLGKDLIPDFNLAISSIEKFYDGKLELNSYILRVLRSYLIDKNGEINSKLGSDD